MTSTTDLHAAARLSTGRVLARAAAAEWTRLWSVRSTWWSLVGAAGLMLLMGVAFGFDADIQPVPVWMAAEIAVLAGQFPLLLVVMLAVTADHATGAIRSSLQWVPRRGVLLTARYLVPVTVMTVVGMLLAIATDVAAAAVADDAAGDVGTIAASVGRIALVLAVGGVLAAGFATVLRSTAAALTASFLLLLMLPAMLPEFGVPWLTAVAEHLPGYATTSQLAALGLDLTTGRAAVVMAVWMLATTAAATWGVFRRDAT